MSIWWWQEAVVQARSGRQAPVVAVVAVFLPTLAGPRLRLPQRQPSRLGLVVRVVLAGQTRPLTQRLWRLAAGEAVTLVVRVSLVVLVVAAARKPRQVAALAGLARQGRATPVVQRSERLTHRLGTAVVVVVRALSGRPQHWRKQAMVAPVLRQPLRAHPCSTAVAVLAATGSPPFRLPWVVSAVAATDLLQMMGPAFPVRTGWAVVVVVRAVALPRNRVVADG